MPLTSDEYALRREVERETKRRRNAWQQAHPRKRGQKQTTPRRKDRAAMQITTIHVDFKATVSDGNYGNETYSVGYTAALSPDEEQHSAVVHLVGLAREHVYGALKHSPRDGIREALETQEERDARYERERQERAERYAQHKAEREARMDALPEDGDSDDTDDDDDGPAF